MNLTQEVYIMKKTVNRDIKVNVCDYCGDETEHLDRCAICKREMCLKDGGAAHIAFSVELYKYGTGQRLKGYGSHVCLDCAEKKFDGTIIEFFNAMMTVDPVPLG